MKSIPNAARLRWKTRYFGSRFRCVDFRCLTYQCNRRATRSQSTSTYSSTHDYVICGAGSAGCVLANRLSPDPSSSVLLLEAGPSAARVPQVQIPAGISLLLKSKKYIWYYNTVPQKHLNNRQMYCPRGKMLGGTSSMNGMVYVRGHPYDYDRWETEGAKGWSYADCLPYFKKSQKHELGPNKYRGGDGPLYTLKGKIAGYPLSEAFFKACEQAGLEYNEDMNGYKQEGYGSYDMTIFDGRRWNTSNAFLRPIEKERKERLQTETKAFVTRILFERNKAVGVEYIKDGQTKRVRAAKEVIISGGAINSPQILMLSGIGDGDELKNHGIPVVCHLPGVGQNLQDHVQFVVTQACTKPITLVKLMNPITLLSNVFKWVVSGKGLLATAHLEAGAFLRSNKKVAHPNVQLHFIPTHSVDYGRTIVKQHAYELHAVLMRPKSRGTIKLKSADPREYPLVDFNYMSAEEDWVEIREIFQITRDILAQQAFDDYRGDEIAPGKECQTEKQVDQFIRENTETIYHHSTSSCKMGDSSDKMAVVDNETRVFGVEGLRVVDASVMPSLISGNTNAPTIMIAEKAADHILGNEMLPRLHVPIYNTENIVYQA